MEVRLPRGIKEHLKEERKATGTSIISLGVADVIHSRNGGKWKEREGSGGSSEAAIQMDIMSVTATTSDKPFSFSATKTGRPTIENRSTNRTPVVNNGVVQMQVLASNSQSESSKNLRGTSRNSKRSGAATKRRLTACFESSTMSTSKI